MKLPENTAVFFWNIAWNIRAATATRKSASTTPTCAPGTPFRLPAPLLFGPGWAALPAISPADRWKLAKALRRGQGTEVLLGELDAASPPLPESTVPWKTRKSPHPSARFCAVFPGKTGSCSCVDIGMATPLKHRSPAGLRRGQSKIRFVPHPQSPAKSFGTGGDLDMNSERLFRILGWVDEDLIEEADTASSPAVSRRRPRWGRRFWPAVRAQQRCGRRSSCCPTCLASPNPPGIPPEALPLQVKVQPAQMVRMAAQQQKKRQALTVTRLHLFAADHRGEVPDCGAHRHLVLPLLHLPPALRCRTPISFTTTAAPPAPSLPTIPLPPHGYPLPFLPCRHPGRPAGGHRFGDGDYAGTYTGVLRTAA